MNHDVAVVPEYFAVELLGQRTQRDIKPVVADDGRLVERDVFQLFAVDDDVAAADGKRDRLAVFVAVTRPAWVFQSTVAPSASDTSRTDASVRPDVGST